MVRQKLYSIGVCVPKAPVVRLPVRSSMQANWLLCTRGDQSDSCACKQHGWPFVYIILAADAGTVISQDDDSCFLKMSATSSVSQGRARTRAKTSNKGAQVVNHKQAEYSMRLQGTLCHLLRDVVTILWMSRMCCRSAASARIGMPVCGRNQV